MKFLFGWFLLFLVVTLVFGWAEVGLCYGFAMAVSEDFFLPLLGIAMTINLLLSLVWMSITQTAEEKKVSKS